MSAGDIGLVARASFSTSEWQRRFGARRYGIPSLQTLTHRCSMNALPSGWRAFKLGHRYFILFTGERAEVRSSTALSREQLLLIRKAARRLRHGEQKAYADRLGISESYFSRLRRGLMSGGVDRLPDDEPPRPPRGVLKVNPSVASRVFGVLLTVAEWIEHVGSRKYQINDSSYTYLCCARGLNGQARVPARLPSGWCSVRVGDSWLIHHSTRAPRSKFLRRKK